MGTSPEPFCIFISYARSDGSTYANRLATELIQVGYAVWWDQRNLDFNSDFTSELETAIAKAEFVVVCITVGSTRADSFVRREIGYALAIHKPIIPVVFDASAVPPISIINITRVQFHGNEWDSAFSGLLDRIRRDPVLSPTGSDPFQQYLESLYQGIVAFLGQTVRKYIQLHAVSTPTALDNQETARSFRHLMLRQLFVGHGLSHADSPEEFGNFAEAVERFGARILLLGEPGSGKTITLLSYARDRVAARLQNSSLPLPLLGLLSTWSPSESFSQWLSAGYTGLAASDIARIIELGQALLLLDGLDEISASEDPSQSRDRQAQFLSRLPANNSIILSSRSEEYRRIGAHASLEATVTLQPITEAQVKSYLADLPELLSVLQASPDLEAIVSTPLLLNLVATACYNLSVQERFTLVTLASKPGDLRDLIVARYVRTRYEWEERRANRLRQELPFSLADTQSYLGRLAMENAGTYRKVVGGDGWDRGSRISNNILTLEDFRLVLGNSSSRAEAFSRFAQVLDVIVKQTEGSLSFRHLMVRDGLAYPYSLQNLYASHLYEGLVEVANPAHALAVTGRSRAVDPLMELLADTDQPSIMRECATDALGFTRSSRCVDALLQNLERKQFLFRSGIALGLLGDPRAFDPLVDLLEHSGKSGKRGAAHGLSGLGDPRAIPFLCTALDRLRFEDDAFTIDSIIQSLARLGELGIIALLEEIRRGLRDSDHFVSLRGAYTLGAWGDRRALELLLASASASASDADPEVRACVAESLAWSGFPDEAGPALERLLSDSAEVPYTGGRRVNDFAKEALIKMKSLQEEALQ